MNIKKVFCCFLFCLCVSGKFLRAQTEPVFSQSDQHLNLLSPSAAGNVFEIQAGFLHRSSFVQLSNRMVSTQAAYFGMPVQKLQSAFGFLVINDQIGLVRNTRINLQYSYFKIIGKYRISAGLGLGLIQSAFRGDLATSPDGDYNSVVDHKDPIIPSNNRSGLSPLLEFGFSASGPSWITGIAVSQIYGSAIRLESDKTAKLLPVLKFHAGYRWKLSGNYQLEPSAIVMSDFRQATAQLNLNFRYLGFLLSGLGARGFTPGTADAFIITQGASWKGFSLTYSYDVPVSGIRKFSAGAHEISLNYRLPLKQKGIRGFFYLNPRYL
jgi:type IX secretion system PorP/SprF family membrane protein